MKLLDKLNPIIWAIWLATKIYCLGIKVSSNVYYALAIAVMVLAIICAVIY